MAPVLDLAIVGGGCSAALAAIHVLEQECPARVTIVDPAERLGLGLAYSTPDFRHLLNVPAGRMGYSTRALRDFAEWCARSHVDAIDPDSFAPRALYGRYLTEKLEAAVRRCGSPSEFHHVRAEAVDMNHVQGRTTVRLSDGRSLSADLVLLALGNAQTRAIPGIPVGSSGPVVFDSPWRSGALESPLPGSPVVLVGSGLTAVDAFLALGAGDHRVPVRMVSGHGLIPQSHTAVQYVIGPAFLPGRPTLRELMRSVRARIRNAQAAGVDWRPFVDGIRCRTNEIWSNLSPAERRRFFRHLKSYWDIHRHRMAPSIGATVRAGLASGALEVHSGRVCGVTENAGVALVQLSLRGGGGKVIAASRVINCAGFEMDYRKIGSPLLRALFSKGWLTAGDLGIGIKTGADGAVRDKAGHASTWLFAIGPMRSGDLLESIAVPEIRQQAESFSRTVAAAAGNDAARSSESAAASSDLAAWHPWQGAAI
jgi:uncharacterized NAD(P)/FAD-binding protein YdhS